MGSTLLQDTVTIYPLSTTNNKLIISLSTFRYHIDVLSNSTINIGKSQNITAVSLISFDEPIKKTDTLDFFKDYTINDIISCKIKLVVNKYAFGDSLNPNSLGFKIFRVQNPWYSNTTWDSLMNENRIDMSRQLGEFNGTIIQSDSMPNIEIDFDKQTFLDWAKIWSDYKDTTISNKELVWGIALVPSDESSVIRQFSGPYVSGSENFSKLTVIYLDSLGNQDTLDIVISIGKSFYDIPEFDKEEMAVQGSTSLRGIINFDLSMIPPLSAIHTAQMELTINPEKSVSGNFGYDSTLLAGLPIGMEDSTINTFKNYYSAERNGNTFYFKSITSAVKTWNRQTGDDFGKGTIVFFPDGEKNEKQQLDKLIFYGINAPDSSLMPKLKIVYSVTQKQKND